MNSNKIMGLGIFLQNLLFFQAISKYRPTIEVSGGHISIGVELIFCVVICVFFSHFFHNMCPLGFVDLLKLFETYSVLVVHFYLYLKMHENEDGFSLCLRNSHRCVFARIFVREVQICYSSAHMLQ